jgi:nucleotide-binding universal stress UspA family protein
MTRPKRFVEFLHRFRCDVGVIARCVRDDEHGYRHRGAYHHIDVIACGTHGRGGVDRVVMGSVAERIVRLARCPVMTVRASADQTPVAA